MYEFKNDVRFNQKQRSFNQKRFFRFNQKQRFWLNRKEIGYNFTTLRLRFDA